MNTKNQRRIVLFFQGIDGIKRHEWTHGTLYLKLEDDRDCDFIHTEIRKFYKGYINPEGGVNMYAVGDEFAFDFVPEDREAPVFTDEEEKGLWSEFAEEEMFNNMDDEDESPAFPSYTEKDQYANMPDEVDMMLNLQEEMKRGKQYGNQFSDIDCDAFGHTCFIQLYVEGTEGMPEDNQVNEKKK